MGAATERTRLLEALRRALAEIEDDAAPIFELARELGKPEHASLAPSVRDELRRAVRERADFFHRDVWAEVLAGMLGVAALPDLLEAASIDLGDDRDTFVALTLDEVEAAPDEAGPILVEAARSQDAGIRREALYLATFLPARAGRVFDALLAGLSDIDPTVRKAVGRCIKGSDWQALLEQRTRDSK
jgi:hypothetical protein